MTFLAMFLRLWHYHYSFHGIHHGIRDKGSVVNSGQLPSNLSGTYIDKFGGYNLPVYRLHGHINDES